MSKVEQRRSRKLIEAVENNNWETVTRLLAQPFNNLERKERHYGVISLNLTISNEGRETEILDLYSDNTYNPIEHLLIKERNELLIDALSKLSKDDLHILLEMTLNGTSALQLTKETSFKSHKTIIKHYEKSLEFLKEELGKYF
jgi:hypothetical protein